MNKEYRKRGHQCKRLTGSEDKTLIYIHAHIYIITNFNIYKSFMNLLKKTEK